MEQRLHLTWADGDRHRTVPVTVDGLDPCLPLFGLAGGQRQRLVSLPMKIPSNRPTTNPIPMKKMMVAAAILPTVPKKLRASISWTTARACVSA